MVQYIAPFLGPLIMPRRFTQPTTTILVSEALKKADDFLTVRQITQLTHRSSNQVTAALHHLRNYHAVQAMPVAGTLYWYQTEEHDLRTRVVVEKRPEIKARKPRPTGPRKKAQAKGSP